MEALGYPLTWLPTQKTDASPGAPEQMREVRMAILASIDQGRPVLLSSEECGLIVGYLDSGRDFLIRPYSAEYTDQKIGYVSMKEWPWEVGIIGRKGQRPPRKTSIVKSLHAAIEMANTGHYGDYPSGFNAYRTWIDGLRDDEGMEEKIIENWWQTTNGNGFIYGCLSDARRAAWRYLRQVSQEFTKGTGAHLARAADYYEQIDKTLWTERPDVPCPWSLQPWDLGKPENWTRDMRHGQSEVLSQVMAIEKQGIREIGLAINALK